MRFGGLIYTCVVLAGKSSYSRNVQPFVSLNRDFVGSLGLFDSYNIRNLSVFSIT